MLASTAHCPLFLYLPIWVRPVALKAPTKRNRREEPTFASNDALPLAPGRLQATSPFINLDSSANNFERGSKDLFKVKFADIGERLHGCSTFLIRALPQLQVWPLALRSPAALCATHYARVQLPPYMIDRCFAAAAWGCTDLHVLAGSRAGELQHVVVRKDNRTMGLGGDWHLQSVEVFHPGLSKRYFMTCNDWFKGQSERKLEVRPLQ